MKLLAHHFRNSLKTQKSGFTLIEILAAFALMVTSITVIIDARTSSTSRILESESRFYAATLAEKIMTEMEIKYQKELNTVGLENALATESGSFDEPYADYKWRAEFRESSIELSPSVMVEYMTSLGVDPVEAQAQIDEQALVLTNVNKVIKENYGELYVEVTWGGAKTPDRLSLVTHLIPNKPIIKLTTTTER